MSKQPAPPQPGGEPPSRIRGGGNAVPSEPGTGRNRNASMRSERQAVPGPPRDGGGTSAAMAAHGERHVSYTLPEEQVVGQPTGDRHERRAAHYGAERPPGYGGAGATTPPPPAAAPTLRKPRYVPPSERKREQVGQPPVLGPGPYGGVPGQQYAEPPRPAGRQPPGVGLRPYGGVPEQQYAEPPRQAGRQPPSVGPRPSGGVPEERQSALPPGQASPREGGHAAPGGAPARGRRLPRLGGAALPPGGKADTPTGAPPHGNGLPTEKPIERVSTLQPEDRTDALPPRERDAPPHRPQHEIRPGTTTTPTTPSPGKRRPAGFPPPDQRRKKQPVAFCFTLCCILFWLLVIAIGLAILVVYLLYHPKPPQLRVDTATLNAGYIDQLPPPRGGLALNSDLYVLAAIKSPNTKIDVVLRYMQVDLYFEGSLIGTQAVWPPIHEEPGDSVLRSVHLVVSEVLVTREEAAVWWNATTKGGPVQMRLRGTFYVQLNFGRWLPFRYWIYPTCTLWLDPPPGGALRRVRCRQ
ncbi:hypothetical protein ACP70R_036240 [Stipagrostis hirtigluma subsp. patula]